MDMIACIEKKKQGFPLSKEEIFAIIKSYTEGDLPEYQMSAFLMAVWFRGNLPSYHGHDAQWRDDGSFLIRLDH